MLESWIPNKALVVFFNTLVKEVIGVPLANFNFCNLIADSSYIYLRKISAQICLLPGHT